jgi:DnaJ family protein C protein 19
VIVKFLVALAVAYLGWRLWYGFAAPKPKPAPVRADVAAARRLLGVGASADEGAIRAAHRRLVASTHPDHGGSDEETRRLNAARDLLLS